MIYILAVLISLCLIAGQSSWGSAVKQIAPPNSHIGMLDLLTKMLANPKLWLGACFYIIGTILYFFLLSKAKFFSVQITMTGLAIVLSVGVSYLFFKESISWMNIVGVVLVLVGIVFVMNR